jgi:hypothetical protein
MGPWWDFITDWWKDARVQHMREKREEENRKIARTRKPYIPPEQFRNIQMRRARKQLVQHQRR